jgi:hypothetical protein
MNTKTAQPKLTHGNQKGQESIKQITESRDYEIQKGIINREVNSLKRISNRYAFPRFASPGELHQTEYSTFKHTQEEKDRIKEYKLELGKAGKMQTLVKAAY